MRSLSCPDGRQDEVLTEYLADKALFVNHSAGSVFVNPCPLGIYAVMFPFQDAGSFVASYQHFVCNSEFTRRHTLARWGKTLRTHVIYPAAEDFVPPPGPRSKDIITIGRFNWLGHNKNHDVMVEAFDGIVDVLPEGYRLVLLGKLNDLPHNQEPFRALQKRCRRLPVDFEINVSEERKRERLARASILWHGTGIGKEEPQDAAVMEHFGIAIVEAMGAGVVPLCYHLGGPREIVEHGHSGYLHRDLDELQTYTLALVAKTELLRRMSAAAIQRARRFTRARFDEALSSFMRSVVLA
jgi:glycosyltransferase involved in cell wall biosynthesis